MLCRVKCIECEKEWDCVAGTEHKYKVCPHCGSTMVDSYYYHDLRKEEEKGKFKFLRRGLFD